MNCGRSCVWPGLILRITKLSWPRSRSHVPPQRKYLKRSLNRKMSINCLEHILHLQQTLALCRNTADFFEPDKSPLQLIFRKHTRSVWVEGCQHLFLGSLWILILHMLQQHGTLCIRTVLIVARISKHSRCKCDVKCVIKV